MLPSSPRKTAAQRGYGARWQRYRAGFLRKHPLCQMHMLQGQVVEASVVDHIVPHKGDQTLFWDKANHQALCKTCHDSHKKRFELSGAEVGCNVDGIPVDPSHPWNQPRTINPGG